MFLFILYLKQISDKNVGNYFTNFMENIRADWIFQLILIKSHRFFCPGSTIESTNEDEPLLLI